MLTDRETAVQTQLEQAAAQEATQKQALALAVREREAAMTDLVNERHRAEDLQQSLSAALHSLSEAQNAAAALRQTGEEAQRVFRVDRARAEATEQRWLREVDRAREETKSAQRDIQTVQTKLANEVRRRTKLEEDLAFQKRTMKQRVTELERRVKSQKKVKNASLRKSAGLGK